MKLLRQFLLIVAIALLGEGIHRFLGLPVPGNVLGMMILFIGLLTGAIKLSYIEETSEFLLKHLAFFFVPAGVGIMGSLNILRGNWIAVGAIVVITTVLVTAATGITVQFVRRIK